MTDTRLKGKTIYGFGDSLMAGHTLGIGLFDDVATQNQMIYRKFAVNGATIMPTHVTDKTYAKEQNVPDVATQILSAPTEMADFITFDGLTNDGANGLRLDPFGTISDDYRGPFSPDNFVGAFENVCFQLRQKYPFSQLIYVGVHHMPLFDLKLQDELQTLAADICHKWSIEVVDVYHAGGINTFIASQAAKYSYNGPERDDGGDGTHLNALGYQKWYAPMLEQALLKHLG